jgi:hypothetical protein
MPSELNDILHELKASQNNINEAIGAFYQRSILIRAKKENLLTEHL